MLDADPGLYGLNLSDAEIKDVDSSHHVPIRPETSAAPQLRPLSLRSAEVTFALCCTSKVL